MGSDCHLSFWRLKATVRVSGVLSYRHLRGLSDLAVFYIFMLSTRLVWLDDTGGSTNYSEARAF